MWEIRSSNFHQSSRLSFTLFHFQFFLYYVRITLVYSIITCCDLFLHSFLIYEKNLYFKIFYGNVEVEKTKREDCSIAFIGFFAVFFSWFRYLLIQSLRIFKTLYL